jgi:hypothetical protein
MRLIFIFRVSIILCFYLMLSGCPAGLNVEFINESKSDLKVLHDNKGKLFTFIESGASGALVQRTNCLRISADNELLEYGLRVFPDGYVASGNSVRMRFSDDKTLSVLPIKPEEDRPITLEAHCS